MVKHHCSSMEFIVIPMGFWGISKYFEGFGSHLGAVGPHDHHVILVQRLCRRLILILDALALLVGHLRILPKRPEKALNAAESP